MNNNYNEAALQRFIEMQAFSIETKDHFEDAKENCITYACKAYAGTLNINGIMKEAMGLYEKVVERYNEAYINPIIAPFTDWLKTQNLDIPNFEGAHKCHDWRNYVSYSIADNWALLTSREKAIIAIIGQAQADSENWD